MFLLILTILNVGIIFGRIGFPIKSFPFYCAVGSLFFVLTIYLMPLVIIASFILSIIGIVKSKQNYPVLLAFIIVLALINILYCSGRYIVSRPDFECPPSMVIDIEE